MIECCAARRRRRWRKDFLLISHTEHNLLLASPCLFFSPSACAHASPVSFWHAHLPTKALCLSPSSSLLLPSLCPSSCLIEKSDTVNQLVVCRGEGERETREVSLAVKNSPDAIWTNRCKTECNKIQVWEITPRVRGGKKYYLLLFFFLFFMLSVSLYSFFFILVHLSLHQSVHSFFPSFSLVHTSR